MDVFGENKRHIAQVKRELRTHQSVMFITVRLDCIQTHFENTGGFDRTIFPMVKGWHLEFHLVG